MSYFEVDYETLSETDIGKGGAWKYASHESTRIIMFAISEEGGTPLAWDSTDPHSWESIAAREMFRRAIESKSLIYAHNVAGFELAISHYRIAADLGLPVPKVETWRCTQAMCRKAGVPPSLKNAAEFLKVGTDKDAIGKKLIDIFSKCYVVKTLTRGKETMKSYSPIREKEIPWDWSVKVAGEMMTVREAWQKFVEYCRQDVRVENAIHDALKLFELKGEQLEGFIFDLKMNIRGVPVDMPALRKANVLINQYQKKLAEKFVSLTGLNPTQTAKVQAWAKLGGYAGANMRAETVEEQLRTNKNISKEVRTALKVRAFLAFAAVKKVPAMLEWACPDNRIRGAFTWHGAQKTGRWTSQGPQFQNMKKPSKRLKKLMEEVYRDVLEWMEIEDIEDFYGNPFEILASMARYFVREENDNVYDVDFAQVEARILPALIGCQRVLDKFIRGEDIYMDVAKALNIDRDMGKVVSLLCQFGGGWKAVKIPLGDKISESDARKAVKVYRKENPEVTEAWKLFQDTFIKALDNPGKWHEATPYVSFGYTKNAPFPRMQMRLPSGRDIVYPYPEKHPITMVNVETTNADGSKKCEWERLKGGHFAPDALPIMLKLVRRSKPSMVAGMFYTFELAFYGHVEGKTYGKVNTYGGDLLQSATQGTGLDFLMHGCIEAERQGFEIFLAVHDQSLARARGGLDKFIQAMCTRPQWFPDFPLEADGHEAASYTKN